METPEAKSRSAARRMAEVQITYLKELDAELAVREEKLRKRFFPRAA